MTTTLNWNSRNLTQGWQKGVTAFYWGLGLTQEDFGKAQIGVGVPLLDGNLCNVHAYELATAIKGGCQESGLLAFPFGVPAVSDNITQGQEGGNASLPSRNMIANGAEAVTSAHCYDALVGLHHCDKNGPGFAMALARLDYPGLVISGGTIMPGCYQGKNVTILDAYDAQASATMGKLSTEEADRIIQSACPGPGGCGIAASFNTWGVALEAIGLMLPFSSSTPAVGDEKKKECAAVGPALSRILKEGIRPSDILTRKAFHNAATAIAAIGGSTNGLLHLLALAQEAQVPFSLKEIQGVLRKTPVLCHFAPRGTGTMIDLHRLGGTPVLLKHLLTHGLLYGDTLTVTARSLEETCRDVQEVPDNQDLIAPVDSPVKPYADIQVCFGNLAPDGVVFKVSSMQSSRFEGSALCFTDPRDIVEAVQSGKVRPGHVCVLRELGPVASGMPEVLVATSALSVPQLDGRVAFVSDTRVSGVSHGAIGVHCAPEAAVGGPIGLVEDGDQISFDLLEGTITLQVSDQTLAERRNAQKAGNYRHTRTYLADFAATTTQANLGCVSRHVARSE